MFKLQIKERDKNDKCTCIIQFCASAYTYSIISLCCTTTIIMIGNYFVTTLISILKDAKWLLKVNRFEKYIFKLKIEPMSICTCPRFHNKSKRLEYLRWHSMCLVDWVYLLRISNSHYLFVCLCKYSSIRIGFKSAVEFWDFYESWNVDLSPTPRTLAWLSRWAAST